MPSKPIRHVIVLGAGGSLGPYVLNSLSSDFVVSILARKSSTSTLPPKFKVHVVGDDYPTTDLLEAFKGQDAVISLISPWQCKSQQHIINAVVEAGVQRFVPAEFGYDTTNENAISLLPSLQERVDIVEYLKAQESKGLSWTAFITGPFFDWGIANGFMGFDLLNRKAMIYDHGNQRFSTCTRPFIGKAVANALLNPHISRNRHMFISSFTTSQNEILESLERRSDGTWDVDRVDSKTMVEQARTIFKNGGDLVEASRLLILAISTTAGNGGDFMGRDSNRELGLVTEDLDEVMAQLVQA